MDLWVAVNFKKNLTENTDKHRLYSLTIKSVAICAICEQFQKITDNKKVIPTNRDDFSKIKGSSLEDGLCLFYQSGFHGIHHQASH